MSAAALARCEAAVTGTDAAIFAQIAEPDVHLALWRRDLPNALLGLAALDWDEIDDIDESVAVGTLATEIPALLGEAGYGDRASSLAADLMMLSERFA